MTMSAFLSISRISFATCTPKTPKTPRLAVSALEAEDAWCRSRSSGDADSLGLAGALVQAFVESDLGLRTDLILDHRAS